MFDLLPTAIRKLANPRTTVKSVSASLQRNLNGFSAGGGQSRLEGRSVELNSTFADMPANQRIQLENIMKKVMGVAYMPEELTG